MLNVLTNIYDKLKFYFILLTQEKNTQDLKYKHTFNTIKHTAFSQGKTNHWLTTTKCTVPLMWYFTYTEGKLLSRLRWQGLMLAYSIGRSHTYFNMILLASSNLNLPKISAPTWLLKNWDALRIILPLVPCVSSLHLTSMSHYDQPLLLCFQSDNSMHSH